MTLTKPDFKLDKANPAPSDIPDAIWWFWLRMDELDSEVKLGGIVADKSGFHASGKKNKSRWPNNYSIRDKVNQSGPGWDKSSAIDLTFPSAQKGDYRNIAKYTKRLWASSHDAKDPRLDLWLFEFYGQTDSDRYVEGYNEYREDEVTSDDSHLWHLHESVKRSLANSFWGAWAVLTVHMGWSVKQWRDSLPATDPNSSHYKPPTPAPKPQPKPPTKPALKHFALGSRELKAGVTPGTDVAYVQRFAGGFKYFGDPDGIPGPKFTSGVKRYQRDILGFRGDNVDGIVGPKTWAGMGVK